MLTLISLKGVNGVLNELGRKRGMLRTARLADADCVDLGVQVIGGMKPDGFETSLHVFALWIGRAQD